MERLTAFALHSLELCCLVFAQGLHRQLLPISRNGVRSKDVLPFEVVTKVAGSGASFESDHRTKRHWKKKREKLKRN